MTDSPVPDETARRATGQDLAAIAALAACAADEVAEQKGGLLWRRRERRPDLASAAGPADHLGPVDPTDPAGLAAALEDDHQEVVAGTLDGVVVGYALVRTERLRDGGLLGVVDELYVEPPARGVGVGEAIMNHCLDWCRSAGCLGVDSLALPGDRATKNFFESFGLVARAIVVHRPLT